MSEGYNGWANYETWAAGLWFDENGMKEEYARIAEDEELTVSGLAKYIKEDLQETAPLLDEASLWSDLLGAALSEIDYFELAQSIFDDFDIEGEEDEED